MNVIEPMTMLYGHAPEQGAAVPRSSLALDLAVIYLHVILPDPLAALRAWLEADTTKEVPA